MIFTVYADRAGITEFGRPAARVEYFSVGRPCLRASDLGKKYGWGIHSDDEGSIALYAVDSPHYATLADGECIGNTADAQEECVVTVVKAMRSSRR